MSINDRVNNIFRTVFKDPNIQIHNAMTAAEVASWDSLTHIEMITAVEKEFGYKFKLKEVTKMKNVGDMLAILENHVNNG